MKPAITVVSTIAILAISLASPGGVLGQVKWEVSETPVLSIGVTEGPSAFLFHDVKGAVRVNDSTIAVGDGGSSEIRVFTTEGAFVTSFGRNGGGPKEFGAIKWLNMCGGSTIVVYDERRHRISKWDVEGNLIEELQIQGPDVEKGSPPYSVSCGPEGNYVVVGWPDMGAHTGELGPYRPDVTIGLLDKLGRVKRVLGSFPGVERYRYNSNDGPRPLGKRTHALRGADDVYVGTADSFTILVFEPEGEARSLGRGDLPVVPLTTEILQVYRDSIIDGTASDRRPGTRRALDSHELPASLPAYSDLRLDRSMKIWIAHYGIPGQPTTQWDVFDPSGLWVASVEMPDDFRLTEIGGDYLLGVGTDPMGVERIEMYSLKR